MQDGLISHLFGVSLLIAPELRPVKVYSGGGDGRWFVTITTAIIRRNATLRSTGGKDHPKSFLSMSRILPS